MTSRTTTAQITDTNRVKRGAMDVTVEFDDIGPLQVQHDGQVYRFTGKAGVNVATGQAVREMATEQEARLWVNMSGTAIWED
jgi:hypothetical protein